MKAMRAVALMLALAGALSDTAPAAATLRQLQGVEELKSWFNGHQGQPRLIFLVSPT